MRWASAACAALLFGACGQFRWSKTVQEFTKIKELNVPISAASMLSLQAALLAKGYGKVMASDFKPVFTYRQETFDGRPLRSRPAYCNSRDVPGQVLYMPMNPLSFLRSALEDPQAEAITINPGVEGSFQRTLDKSQVERLIDELKTRGLSEANVPLAVSFNPGGSHPVPPEPGAPSPPSAPEPVRAGSSSVRLTACGPNKIAVIKAVRLLKGLGLKEAKDLVEGAPTLVGQNLAEEDAVRWAASLAEAGATAEVRRQSP